MYSKLINNVSFIIIVKFSDLNKQSVFFFIKIIIINTLMHHLSLVIIFCIKETSCISLCCNYHKMQQCTIFCNKDTHDIFLSQYPFHTKIHIKNKSFIIATFSVLNTQIIYLYVTIIYIYILIYFLSIYQSFYLSIHLFSIYLYSVY